VRNTNKKAISHKLAPKQNNKKRKKKRNVSKAYLEKGEKVKKRDYH